MQYWKYARWGIAALIVFIGGFAGVSMARGSIYTEAKVDTFVYNGPWYTDNFGAKDATPLTRAYTAVVGLLALSRQETLYYLAHDDSDGNPISSDAVYEITGMDMPSRWWSITLYGEDHFLLDNPENRYSVKATEMEREPDGSFRVVLSKEPQPGNWIPMDAEGENVTLLLRMYNPDSGALDRIETIDLPEIHRVRNAS